MTALSVAVPAPDFAVRLKALVRDSVHNRESKRAYARAVDDFLQWFAATRPASGFSKATVQAYRAQLVESGLASSTVNLRRIMNTTAALHITLYELRSCSRTAPATFRGEQNLD